VDQWITAAPLEVDLRQTAGHTSRSNSRDSFPSTKSGLYTPPYRVSWQPSETGHDSTEYDVQLEGATPVHDCQWQNPGVQLSGPVAAAQDSTHCSPIQLHPAGAAAQSRSVVVLLHCERQIPDCQMQAGFRQPRSE
jgi:hypothetical protein